jgi:tetratricopeptide (TPR) repeat protein
VARVGSAVEARSCFADFIARWPQSPLRPDVELAIARTYERQHDWTDAVTRYAGWISTWSNSPSLPLAEYSLAWAQFKADDETNAFAGFSSFVEKYPTNELAAQAHNWIGRYHFEREEWGPAEDSFQTACNAKTGATAELKFEAKLMAGRAAWMRQSYRDAANYFRELGSDTNSPEGKRSEAEFALADVQSMSYTATNLSAVKDAIEIYASIGSQPTNELAPAAWGMIAGCYLLLANKTNPACYLDASNYYEKVITATNAGLPIARLPFRCLAEYGIAQTLVGLAGLSPRKSTEWQANLEGAIEHCLVVVNGDNLLVGESSNLREVERSGLEAGRLMEELEHWGDAMKLYETLSAVLDLPSARSALEARMAAVRPHLPARAR